MHCGQVRVNKDSKNWCIAVNHEHTEVTLIFSANNCLQPVLIVVQT